MRHPRFDDSRWPLVGVPRGSEIAFIQEVDDHAGRDQQQVRAFNADVTGNIFMGATAGKVAFLTFRQLALSATPSRSNEFARVVLPNLAARLRFRRRTRCTSGSTEMTPLLRHPDSRPH